MTKIAAVVILGIVAIFILSRIRHFSDWDRPKVHITSRNGGKFLSTRRGVASSMKYEELPARLHIVDELAVVSESNDAGEKRQVPNTHDNVKSHVATKSHDVVTKSHVMSYGTTAANEQVGSILSANGGSKRNAVSITNISNITSNSSSNSSSSSINYKSRSSSTNSKARNDFHSATSAPTTKRPPSSNLSQAPIRTDSTTTATGKTRSKIFQQMTQSGMTSAEKRIALELLDTFVQAMNAWKIPYFLYSGTLLDSWRHHGMIPWDDDLDVMIAQEQKRYVFYALRQLSHATQGKVMVYDTGARLKFWSYKSKITTELPWRWPYVDIQFYATNATHLWDVAPEFENVKFNKSSVFPLRYRPFENRLLPAPRDTFDFLRAVFGDATWCQTWWYSHKFEDASKMIKIPCEKLAGDVPFVHRIPADGVVEILKLGKKTINVWWGKYMPQTGLKDPYTLKLD